MRKLICGSMIGLFVAGAASASEWRYTYTGNDLTQVTSACCGTPDTPFTTSDFISFEFTSPSALGANWNDAGFSAPITSWSLSVGPLSYSSAGGPTNVLYSINFSTNAMSQITGYQFTTQTDVVAPNLIPYEYPPTIYLEEVFSFDLPGVLCCEDGMYHSADLPGQRLRFQFQRFWNVDHHVDPRAGYLGHVSARHDWPRCHWPSAGTVRGSDDRAALTRRGRDAAERSVY